MLLARHPRPFCTRAARPSSPNSGRRGRPGRPPAATAPGALVQRTQPQGRTLLRDLPAAVPADRRRVADRLRADADGGGFRPPSYVDAVRDPYVPGRRASSTRGCGARSGPRSSSLRRCRASGRGRHAARDREPLVHRTRHPSCRRARPGRAGGQAPRLLERRVGRLAEVAAYTCRVDAGELVATTPVDAVGAQRQTRDRWSHRGRPPTSACMSTMSSVVVAMRRLEPLPAHRRQQVAAAAVAAGDPGVSRACSASWRSVRCA